MSGNNNTAPETGSSVYHAMYSAVGSYKEKMTMGKAESWGGSAGTMTDNDGDTIHCPSCGKTEWQESDRHTVAHGETSATYTCTFCGRYFQSRGAGDYPFWDYEK